MLDSASTANKRANTNDEVTPHIVHRADTQALFSSDPSPSDVHAVKSEPQDDESNSGFEAETGIADLKKPMPDVERMLWIPKKSSGGIWLLRSQQPDVLRAGTAQKFEEDFLSNDARRKIYHTMLRAKEKYVEYGCCLNMRQYLRSTRPGDYSKADGNTARACNFCIKTKRLCAKLVEVEEEIRLAIYPLPAGSRASTVKWDDLEYWVRG
jgi:hypothetical protein